MVTGRLVEAQRLAHGFEELRGALLAPVELARARAPRCCVRELDQPAPLAALGHGDLDRVARALAQELGDVAHRFDRERQQHLARDLALLAVVLREVGAERLGVVAGDVLELVRRAARDLALPHVQHLDRQPRAVAREPERVAVDELARDHGLRLDRALDRAQPVAQPARLFEALRLRGRGHLRAQLAQAGRRPCRAGAGSPRSPASAYASSEIRPQHGAAQRPIECSRQGRPWRR